MAKSPDAFRTISEVATWLGTQAHVLRFWESKFDAVAPVQRTGGRRYYRMADMLLLGGIKFLLHEQGMTIKAVQNLLKEQGVAHVQSFSPAIEGETQQKESTPEVSHAETSAPEENVVDLQFDPAKLSQSVVLSERLERDDDGTQLLLFPELADEVPLADPKSHVDAAQSRPRHCFGHRFTASGSRSQQFPTYCQSDDTGVADACRHTPRRPAVVS